MNGLGGLDDLVRVYRALGDGTRLRLVKLLADLEPEGALCVNALVGELGVSQPAVSQHLRVLRAAGLVIGERRGYHVHYRLNAAALAAYRNQALALLGDEFMASSGDGGHVRQARPASVACQVEQMHHERTAATTRAGRRERS
jgi:DNA-binding transcriptional ArsR family regulator